MRRGLDLVLNAPRYDAVVPGKEQQSRIDGADAAGEVRPCASLAVALTAMNSLRTIEATLRSVLPLASTVVVIDSGSTDGTIELARSLGATVEHHPWAGHVKQKQHAIDRCQALAAGSARWVLLLDSDEAVDPTLAEAIREVAECPNGACAGYELTRRLVLHGATLHYTFQPERRLRLFAAGAGRVVGVPPHDAIDVAGAVGRLPGALLHDSWADADDMLRRNAGYARITAEQSAVLGEAAAGAAGGGLIDILIRPGAAFVKQYLLRQGFRDGWRGLVAAGGAAASALMKHIALAERKGLASEGSRSAPTSAVTPPRNRS